MKQLIVALALLVSVWPAYGQSSLDATVLLPPGYAGPPAPTGNATVSRDAQGHVTSRAIRLTAPLKIDGRLDEAFYREYSPMSDFVQNDPNPGAAATEKTDVWVAFDADNIYVTFRAWESEPARMVADEMRRDSINIIQNENVAFGFDTFYDRRNSFHFSVNPLGGRTDGQNTNEGQYNGDWNPVWTVNVARFDGGWSVEASIPFKSLRYQSGTDQVWGFNARRISRWKNEVSFLSRVADGTGSGGILRISQAATLVGLQVPASGRTLDVKPYAISDVTTDVPTTRRNDPGADFGVDAKYTVTENLTADFTYNTDFAQVEADEQQVNLTRFSLFYPEKREVFLENLGLFGFGGANQQAASEVPLLFYSRRIGLDEGHIVPIDVGGRLIGRVGAYNVGLINIQTASDEAHNIGSANYSVARLRRDVLRKSAVGLLFTRRDGSTPGETNDVIGIDGRWAFFENLVFNTYWAKTRTPGVTGDDTSNRLHMEYTGDRYGLTLHRIDVGANFNPEVGYVKRSNALRNLIRGRFSPRPTRIKAVRKFSFEAEVHEVDNSRTGMLETRARIGHFKTEFQNSDALDVEYEDGYDAFLTPFRIATGVIIPAGGYDLRTLRLSWTAGQQRRAAGKWMLERGPFYNGDRTTLSYSTARVRVNARLAFEPSVSVNKVTLPYGDFTATALNNRVTYTMTPMMFVSGLIQYNSGSHSVGTNVRFRWEYLPASELFVVYNEGRDTSTTNFPAMQNRSIVVKVSRLLRF